MVENVIIREAGIGDSAKAAVLNVETFRKEFDFSNLFEKDVLESFGEYAGGLEYPSMLWVAEKDGVVIGSVSIYGRGESEGQLRWFCVTPELQSIGIGSMLLEKALAFCDEKGYKDIYLWTIDILESALHLYDKYGFRRVEFKDNNEWANGRTVVDIKMIKGYNK